MSRPLTEGGHWHPAGLRLLRELNSLVSDVFSGASVHTNILETLFEKALCAVRRVCTQPCESPGALGPFPCAPELLAEVSGAGSCPGHSPLLSSFLSACFRNGLRPPFLTAGRAQLMSACCFPGPRGHAGEGGRQSCGRPVLRGR